MELVGEIIKIIDIKIKEKNIAQVKYKYSKNQEIDDEKRNSPEV